MDLLYEIAEAIVRFNDSAPSFPIALVYIMVAGLPVILLHELGHAVAAVQLLDEEVDVSVGEVGKLAELRLGQIALSVNALAHPGKAAGAAEFDASRATARDVLLIALAGPAASLAGTVITVMALNAVSPGGVVHGLLWGATVVGVFGVLNLIPFRFRERRDGPAFTSDGLLALEALRVARALR
jgi:hypothetical protein